MNAPNSYMERLKSAVTQRVNGWANLYTGLGQSADDVGGSRTTFDYQPARRIPRALLDTLYHEDAFAARICDAVPKHALRRGFKAKLGNPEQESAVNAVLDDLKVSLRVIEAWTWSRVEGGGALVLGIDDGQQPDQPVNTDRLRGIRFLASLTAREIWPETWDFDPVSSRFGEPIVYRLQRVGGGGATDGHRVHYSRVIAFDGLPTTRTRRAQLNGWGESVLQRAWPILSEWNGAHLATNTLLQDASQGVMKLKNLAKLMASDPDGIVKRRLEVMEIGRSVAHAIVLDADSEEFTRTEVGSLSGLPDILDRMSLRLAGACEIPVSILLGREPAGLNATGDADIRAWYDAVDAQRRTVLLPALDRITKLVLLSREGPTKGQEPEGWSVDLPPLWEPTDGERADLRLKTAQTDQIYITAGVVSPEEVALSRFRPEGWSAETTVDMEARSAALEADKAAGALPTPTTPTTPPEPTGTDPSAPSTPSPTSTTSTTSPPRTDSRMNGGSGVVVVLPLPADLARDVALPGGEAPEDLHVTLSFHGAAADFDADAIAAIEDTVRQWASARGPIAGKLSGVGRFSGDEIEGDPVYLSVDAPALASARQELVEAFAARNIPVSSGHGFTPHATRAYLPADAPSPVDRFPLRDVVFPAAAVWAGVVRTLIPFGGQA